MIKIIIVKKYAYDADNAVVAADNDDKYDDNMK